MFPIIFTPGIFVAVHRASQSVAIAARLTRLENIKGTGLIARRYSLDLLFLRQYSAFGS